MILRLRTLLLSLLAMGATIPNAFAGVTLNDYKVLLDLRADASDTINGDFDSEVELNQDPPDIFERSVVAGVSSGGIASANWVGRLTKTQSADSIVLECSSSEDVLSQDNGPTGPTTCSNANASVTFIAELDITVTGEPILAKIERSGSQTVNGTEGGCGGSSHALFNGLQIRDSATNEITTQFGAARLCSTRVVDLGNGGVTGSDQCAFNEGQFEVEIAPGTYRVQVSIETLAGRTASAIAINTWKLTLSEPPPCTLTWNEFGAGGLFSDESNWSPEVSPTDDDEGCNNLLVDRNGSFSIGVSGIQEANRIDFRTGTATLQSSTGGELRLSSRGDVGEGVSDAGLVVGAGADLIIGGARVNADGVVVGDRVEGDDLSTLLVSGVGSELSSRGTVPENTAPNFINVGDFQDAVLEIASGGAVTGSRVVIGNNQVPLSPNPAKGTVLVRGVSGGDASLLLASTELIIGNTSEGALRVTDGGQVKTIEGGDVKVGVTGDAELSVSGVNAASSLASTIDVAGTLIVPAGNSSSAAVFVDNGGKLSANEIFLGDNNGQGSLSIDKAGEVDVVNRILVGITKNAQVLIGEGSILSSEELIIGVETGGVGSVEASGELLTAGSIIAESIEVGSNGGRGTLTLSGGATAETNFISVPLGNNANGKVDLLEFSSLKANDILKIGQDSPGEVNVRDVSFLNVINAVEIGAFGILRVESGGTQVFSPVVRITEAGGKLVGIRSRGKQGVNDPALIQGNVELVQGAIVSIEADADGTPALKITGDLLAAGNLEIRFPAGVEPTANSLFNLLQVDGTISGAFAQVTSPDRSADFSATASVENGELLVRVVNPGEDISTGEGEGEGEGEPTPPSGCDGCRGDSAPIEKALGDVLSIVFGLALLMGAHLHFRRRLVLSH